MNKDNNRSFRFTISLQYFLYFGIMGITLPYFNLYCYHLDFSGSQIGILSALRSVVAVLFSLIWGRLADRFQTRRPIYIICNFISTAFWVFFLYTTDFHGMIVVTISYVIFHAPIISFLEAFTMDVLGREKKSYGRIRVWGTLSFIAVSIILGKAIELYSVKIILILILAGSLLQAIFSLRSP
ncbi:MFS transporter, partial [Desulfobacterales bacterium HSG2]|nr:MFS transporter [Desulfobacterales bacterium HSG2]